MPFVPIDQHLHRHPKTRELARILGKDARYTVGLLAEVWSWAIDAKPDGMISEVPVETLVSVFGGAGTRLVDAMRTARFVCTDQCLSEGRPADKHRPGRFHDWDEWAGRLVRSRLDDRLRKEHARSGHPRPVDNCPSCRRVSEGQTAGTSTNRAPTPRVSVRRPGDTPRLSERTVHQTTPHQTTEQHTPRTAELRSDEGARVSAGQRLPTPEERRTENEAQALEILATATGTWQTVLGAIREQLPLHVFVSWFRGTRLEERDGIYVVVAPNTYARDWLREKYAHVVRASIGVVVGDVDVQVTIDSEDVQPREEASA